MSDMGITPEMAADILGACYRSSLNKSTREQLQKIAGETKRPERERPPTKRGELLEAARERLRWAEEGGYGFAVIHGSVDDNRKMQVSFVNGFDLNATDNLGQPHGGFLLALEAARVLFHEARGEPVIPEPWPPDQGCPLPPPGWYCSRPPGHEGACPARQTG
jgi:hypothetical protein